MIRFGLCCLFKEQPIHFRRTTATYLSTLPVEKQHLRLSEICLSNADNLYKALVFCHQNNIGCFRVNSQILPLKTHPIAGYRIDDLPDADAIYQTFKACGDYSRANNLRLTFHPDQFIVLSSPNPDVVARSVAELAYQAEVAAWVNADVINIHAGGVYGDKPAALKRFCNTVEALPAHVREKLTIENDDISYSPEDILPVCSALTLPLVYDVHHHRCLPDTLTSDEATQKAIDTWNREPLFHISSPLNTQSQSGQRKHHDYIDITDFPETWREMAITVEVEAKAKELAVVKLMRDLNLI